MFEPENIRDWRQHDVVDDTGAKIGKLESIYVDTATDQPVFASVTTGLPGRRHLVFVPLAGAMVAPDHLKVRYDKKHVKSAPSIDTDGELLAGMEPALFDHYGLGYEPGVGGERRLARR
jgi:hypothetical protein